MSWVKGAALEQWLSVLGSEEVGLTAEEIADACWLAMIQQRFGVVVPQQVDEGSPQLPVRPLDEPEGPVASGPLSDEVDEVPKAAPPRQSSQPEGELFPQGSPLPNRPAPKQIRVPAAAALRDPLALARALRPLMQQRALGKGPQLDEPATVQKIAEERVWWPITQPLTENWLELAIVVDESASMLLWRRTVEELTRLCKHYGIFRDVRLWGLVAHQALNKTLAGHAEGADQNIFIRPHPFSRLNTKELRSPDSLIEPTGRRLILMLTDCVDDRWQMPQLLSALELWGNNQPMALLQMMPEWLWPRTHLRQTALVALQGKSAGDANYLLDVVSDSFVYRRRSAADRQADIKIPIITLESDRVYIWTRMLAAQGTFAAPGVLFNRPAQHGLSANGQHGLSANGQADQQPEQTESGQGTLATAVSASRQVQTFRGAASPLARRLASLLAASPDITLQVIQIVQAKRLPQSQQVHVAEVLLGGLLQPVEKPALSSDPGNVRYQFADLAVRSVLLAEAPVTDTTAILSDYIQEKYEISLNDFVADFYLRLETGGTAEAERRPIAIVAAEVLRHRGEAEYRAFVSEVKQRYGRTDLPVGQAEIAPDFPPLEPFDFVDAQLIDDAKSDVSFPPPLQTEEFTVITFEDADGFERFDFTVVTLQRRPRLLRRDKQEIQQQRSSAYRLVEKLPNDGSLEMVAIPAGTFIMGSPESELERQTSESPQHEVTIESFFMGRYPVTQAQWKAVAGLPQIARALQADPSRFKDDLRPVENVSWDDAVEFCARLSAHTGRNYRLPTEAEWEYACRAGTNTAFHFGDTITTEIANYNGSAYAQGPKGERRGTTTPVDYFEGANAFGLSDMHGNVWEWCADHWHNSYEGAPTDGSAWLTDDDDAYRILRGGAWYLNPRNCRSAIRIYGTRVLRYFTSGFRVSCSSPRT